MEDEMEDELRQIIINWYESHGERYRINGDFLISRCVYHGGDNPTGLSVNLNTGRVNCWTRRCRFNPLRFFGIDKNLSPDQLDKLKTATPRNNKITQEFYDLLALTEGYLELYPKPFGHYLEYLHSRGILDPAIDHFEIRCCDDPENVHYQRVVFPMRSRNGSLINFCLRDITNTKSDKYLYYGVPKFNFFYNIQHYNPNKPLILVEGVIDLITLRMCGVQNVISPLSVNMTMFQKMAIANCINPSIIFAFDNTNEDIASSIAIDDILGFLNEQNPLLKVGLATPKLKDWNQMWTENLGGEIKNIINQAIKYSVPLERII